MFQVNSNLRSQPQKHKLKMGFGMTDAHHGELLQGVFINSAGRLSRGLVTLPCNKFHSQAIFSPHQDTVNLDIRPQNKSKAKQAAQLTLKHLGVELGGSLHIWTNIPTGLGLGSSTADVVATSLAVANALGKNLSPETIAKIAVEAETASDSIMFGNCTTLFAQREGIVIENFGNPLPPLEILGFNTDLSNSGIDTLAFPPARYNSSEIEEFSFLRKLIRQAVLSQSPDIIGQVASASARINQRHLPLPNFELLMKLVKKVGALGLQVSHSGTVAGLIFAPDDSYKQQKVNQGQVLLAQMGITQTWLFQNT